MNHIFSKCPDFDQYGDMFITHVDCLWCLKYYLGKQVRDHSFTKMIELKIKKLEYDKSFQEMVQD